ncbi:MAG TPA: hypothetical protein VGG22_16300 [Candidatus Baltobacteraceae bacterium]|jgi:glutathione synthase/RimK-type ligase-like ATP-grasp enzyme
MASDFATRNDLGLKLWNEGKRKEAFAMFLENVERFPTNATAHSNLAFVFLRAGALNEAKSEYENALRLEATHADAKRGLAAVLAQLGKTGASELREIAGTENAITVLPYRGSRKPISVVLLVSLGSGNLHLEKLLDDRIFATTKVVVELFAATNQLPPFDMIFNAIGDADSGAEALMIAQRIVAGKRKGAVLNPPDRVLHTTRVENASRLRAIPGVLTPRTQLFERAALAREDGALTLERHGFAFPLLLRSPGQHTGHNFNLIERSEDLALAVAALPGDQLYAIEYIDLRGRDGKVRKYRVMFVDGRLYPLHLAISNDWKVHYFSADMANVPEHRAEDERFLADMPDALGTEAVATLGHIANALGLDYAGIDFALGPDGQIVIFETNATMVIVEPGEDVRWDYRKAPVQHVIDAVRAMLLDRASL